MKFFAFLLFCFGTVHAQNYPITAMANDRSYLDSNFVWLKNFHDVAEDEDMTVTPIHFMQWRAQQEEPQLRAENEALVGPTVACSNGRTRQVCTYRLERLSDDSIAGMVYRLTFVKRNGQWNVQRAERAHRCGRGSRTSQTRYHTQTCR